MLGLEMGENNKFSIVLHWEGDFFILDDKAADFLCFMDLCSDVHAVLRLDCDIKLRLEGDLPRDRRILIRDDGAMLIWLEENFKEGNILLHLYVEAENKELGALLVGSGNGLAEPVIDSDDSFDLSDCMSVEAESDGDHGMVKGLSDYSDFEPETYNVDLDGSDCESKRPYLDRAYKGKRFFEQKEDKIILEKGMLFASVHDFRGVLRDFVIQEGFEIVRSRNERSRITAMYASKGCDWYIHASTNADGETFEVKVYVGIHTYVKKSTNKCVTSTWIAKKMASQFRADPNLSYESIQEYIMATYGVEVSKSQMYRAKVKAKEEIEGSHAKTYSKIKKYAELVRESNPGTVARLQVERLNLGENPAFKRFFLCLHAMKQGFVQGCRPFIGLDDCHLKGPYGGVMLAAVSLDGNNGIFPIAFAVVEIENKDSWSFFLHLLATTFGSHVEDSPLVIMINRQKGLDQAIVETFLGAQHRWCCHHLYNNFKGEFPGAMLRSLFWKAARAYCFWEFKEAMDAIKAVNSDAFNWLDKVDKKMWARHAYDAIAKSDHITNMTESFNQWCGQLRGKPVLTMIEALVVKIMGTIHKRKSNALAWQRKITPNSIKKLEQMRNMTGRLSLVPAGQMEFAVNSNGKRFPVDLKTFSCPCNIWRISGLPCKHALTCLSYLRLDLEDYCHAFYSKDLYLKAYDQIIHPVPDLSMVDIIENPDDVVLPPVLRRLPGMPRRNRRKAPDEQNSGPIGGRRSATVRCHTCKRFGHNKRTCQRDLAGPTVQGSNYRSSNNRGRRSGNSGGIVINEPAKNNLGESNMQSQQSTATGPAARRMDEAKAKGKAYVKRSKLI